jgi:hypothetical protein
MDRYELIRHLLTEEDRINNEYISGQIERDTWAKNLQVLNERLNVLGLRLTIAPWTSKPQAPDPFA